MGDIATDLQPSLQKDRLGCYKLNLQKMFVTVNKSFVSRKTIFICSEDTVYPSNPN